MQCFTLSLQFHFPLGQVILRTTVKNNFNGGNNMQLLLAQNKDYILNLWNKIEQKVSITSDRIKDSMPYTTKNGIYDDCQDQASWWTNTFWTGILWHMYRETNDEKYRAYAESIENKMDEVLYGYDELHHDVGFMWLLSSVMNYEITGNIASKKRAMLAANVLSARGNIAGNFIRAWNGDNAGWAIIDCMMNIPLLYWASQQSNDDRFKHIAMMHANKTANEFVREDGSVNHIVIFDEKTGEVLEIPRGQGYESGSSWSRGQSWALYGFAQSYNWTKNMGYLSCAKKIAHYVISNLAQNEYVPLCDYRQPVSSELLDSSAGAITACGLIEIAKAVPKAEQSLYLKAALDLLKALDNKCGVWDGTDEALLINGTSQFHVGNGRYEVVNGALIYGDYYFVDAICKLKELL
jgi:unsaturated chondroitin disaccharide hydrolase